MVLISASDGTAPLPQETVKVIRSYLSRGIALFAQMSTSGNNELDYYTGKSVIGGACTRVDHAVNIVGYGKKDGTDVWVVRNSWGAGFGSNGNFYTTVGNNSFCIESLVGAVIPKHYNTSISEAISSRGDIKRTSSAQLDKDDSKLVLNTGEYSGSPAGLPSWGVALISLAGIVVLGMLLCGCLCCARREKQLIRHTNTGVGM